METNPPNQEEEEEKQVEVEQDEEEEKQEEIMEEVQDVNAKGNDAVDDANNEEDGFVVGRDGEVPTVISFDENENDAMVVDAVPTENPSHNEQQLQQQEALAEPMHAFTNEPNNDDVMVGNPPMDLGGDQPQGLAVPTKTATPDGMTSTNPASQGIAGIPHEVSFFNVDWINEGQNGVVPNDDDDDDNGNDQGAPLGSTPRLLSELTDAAPPPNLNEAMWNQIRANDPSLTKLALGGAHLNDTDMLYLCDALLNNVVVEAVDLSDNDFGTEGLSCLAKTLATPSSSIVVLRLSQNPQIGDFALFGKALGSNHKLVELDLTGNSMGSPPSKMQGFVDNLLAAAGMHHSSPLRRLDVSNNQLGNAGTASLARLVAHSRTLNALVVNHNGIGPEGAKELARALAENTSSVAMLDLSWNDIGPDGTRYLMAMMAHESSTVTDLHLHHNALGPTGAQEIGRALASPDCSLLYLYTSENTLGDDGIQAVAEGLAKNETMLYIDLGKNHCTRASVAALEKALVKNHTITKIDMRGNERGVMAPNRLLARNRLLRNHQQAFQEIGPSLFIQAKGGVLQWTDEVLDSAKIDEGLEWQLLQRALTFVTSANSDRAAEDTYRDINVASHELYELGQQPSAMTALMHTRLQEENTLLHYAIASTTSEGLKLCKFMVGSLGADMDFCTNAKGQSARDIGTLSSNGATKKWCEQVGLFLQRYSIEGGLSGPPVYKSATCTILQGQDLTAEDDDVRIMVTVVEEKRDFLRELACRMQSFGGTNVDVPPESLRFDPDRVLPMLRYHDEKLGEKNCRCLVMPQFERNLQQIIRCEFVAGREVDKIVSIASSIARAIDDVHENRIAHCNISPPRIVRHEGNYKLLGFELAMGFGKELVLQRKVSQYCPPELAKAILKPTGQDEELEKRLLELRSEQKELAAKSADKRTDDRLKEIIVEIHRLQALIDLTLRNNNNNNNNNGSRKASNPKASTATDVWAFGVVLYELLTGEYLFPSTNVDEALANIDDQLALATWKGLSQAQLDRVLAGSPAVIPRTTIRRAQDLLLRCLHPDPLMRFESMVEIQEHRFLTQVPPTAEDDHEIRAPVRSKSSVRGTDGKVAEGTTPTCFLILPFRLDIDSSQNGKVVAPASAKEYLDALVHMQEYNALQQLLNAKLNNREDETRRTMASCRREPDPNVGVENLLSYLGVTDSSLAFFRNTIDDKSAFLDDPLLYFGEHSGRAFNHWWKFYQDQPHLYFYIVDEYYQRPVVVLNSTGHSTYPIELRASATALRDLVPFLCLSLTSVNILMAVASLVTPTSGGSKTSLPSRLKEDALLDLDRLNRECTMTDYHVLRNAFEKLATELGHDYDNDDKDEPHLQDIPEQPRFRNFSSVEEARLYELEVFFDRHDPQGDFGGLGWVLDRDGMVRWTSAEGQSEMKHVDTMSMAEHLSRKRQLEEALKEVEQKLKLEQLKTVQSGEEINLLLREKKALLENKQNLETYIEEQRAASQQCCVIL